MQQTAKSLLTLFLISVQILCIHALPLPQGLEELNDRLLEIDDEGQPPGNNPNKLVVGVRWPLFNSAVPPSLDGTTK
ncbi:hypothetical protein MMC21_007075 [Puttea exsequens]|nr:hypothetical protein [Puttea exsequens]